MAAEPQASAPRDLIEPIRALASDSIDSFTRAGRNELATRVRIALARLERPSAIVCVVGEFKQGKSAVVNELVGRLVCSVDDDLSTSAITLVHHADEVRVTVRHRPGDEVVVETIATSDLPMWVSERGNPDNQRAVERVEVGLPNRFLEIGPALVDTPGAGGLSAGHAAATLAFLPYADALLFVSDASAELAAPELDYLVRASAACPVVLFCLTKIDLYPEWRRIAELDRGHLARAGLDLPIVAVSSMLRNLALQRGDPTLNTESGFPELLRELADRVLSRTRALATTRLATEIEASATEAGAALRTELEVIDDPARLAETIARLDAAQERLEHLKAANARWSIVLNDRFTDLANDVTHQLRTGVRSLLRDADAEFEHASSEDEWKALAASLQDRLAQLVGDIFQRINDGAAETRRAIADLIRDEDSAAMQGTYGPGSLEFGALSVTDASGSADGNRRSDMVVENVDRGLNLVRGAYGAVAMFSILGRFLPAAAGSVLLGNPFTIGAGVAFGIKQLRDQRKKRVAGDRLKARTAFRSAVEQVQQEISKAIADAVREAQRDLRDGFAERINELQRANAEIAVQCRASAAHDQQQRETRRPQLVSLIETSDRLVERSRALEGSS